MTAPPTREGPRVPGVLTSRDLRGVTVDPLTGTPARLESLVRVRGASLTQELIRADALELVCCAGERRGEGSQVIG
jgi:hypothetical protein